MRVLAFLCTAAIGALAGAGSASAVTLKTNWNEVQPFSNGKGFLRIYVRRIEITKSSWKAWVGIVNRGGARVQIEAKQTRNASMLPVSYFAGPGLWWQTFQRGGHWWPGSGSSLTHSARATTVRPRYPTALANGKSWFGTFSGEVRGLPKNRLLRVGFGIFHLEGHVLEAGTRVLPRTMVVSTTHQFRLPRV